MGLIGDITNLFDPLRSILHPDVKSRRLDEKHVWSGSRGLRVWYSIVDSKANSFMSHRDMENRGGTKLLKINSPVILHS